MNKPDPTYAATIPGAPLPIPEPPTLPAWAQAYFMQRRRALLTELREINVMLGMVGPKDNGKQLT